MKKISIILMSCCLMSVTLSISAQTKVGVYVLTDEYKSVLISEIETAFNRSSQYIVINRSKEDHDALQFARKIHEKGHIDDKQTLNSTNEYGESQLCVVKVYEVDNMYYFAATLSDASTNARIKSTLEDLPKSEMRFPKILEIAEKLTSQLLPDVQRSNLDFKSLQATSDVEMARKNVEENKRYDITYATFKNSPRKYTDNCPAADYYMDKYYRLNEAGYVVIGVVGGLGIIGFFMYGLLGKEDINTKLIICSSGMTASCLPGIVLYSVAPAYRKKAWKEYRKPYDDAVKDLDKARKYQQRASLQISPAIGYDWAGIGFRVTIH